MSKNGKKNPKINRERQKGMYEKLFVSKWHCVRNLTLTGDSISVNCPELCSEKVNTLKVVINTDVAKRHWESNGLRKQKKWLGTEYTLNELEKNRQCLTKMRTNEQYFTKEAILEGEQKHQWWTSQQYCLHEVMINKECSIGAMERWKMQDVWSTSNQGTCESTQIVYRL